MLRTAMRFSNVESRRRVPAEINVTSLVDIIFNLLLFFMLTTSFSQSSGLQVELPSASESDAQVGSDDLVIVLTASGEILIDGKVLSLHAVEQAIAQLKARAQDAIVFIQADAEVAHGRVVEVINAAKRQAVHSVAIATDGN